MEGRQRAKGKEPGLNRVPCPEAVLERVIVRGESAVGEELGWLGLLTVQAIGWLRADSLAGLERGDVCVEAARASVAIRYKKNRPEFRDNPGLLEWTHGPTSSPQPPSTIPYCRANGSHARCRQRSAAVPVHGE